MFGLLLENLLHDGMGVFYWTMLLFATIIWLLGTHDHSPSWAGDGLSCVMSTWTWDLNVKFSLCGDAFCLLLMFRLLMPG